MYDIIYIYMYTHTLYIRKLLVSSFTLEPLGQQHAPINYWLDLTASKLLKGVASTYTGIY